MKLLQRFYLVLLYLFCSLSLVLGCIRSLTVYRDYATFELPATSGGTIKTDVILMVHEILGQQNTGSLKLAEELSQAQTTLDQYGIVRYNLFFPRSSTIPTITQISQNEAVICRTEFIRDSTKSLTTIRLTSTLTSITPAGQSNHFRPIQVFRPTLPPTPPPTLPPPRVQEVRPNFDEINFSSIYVPQKIPIKMTHVDNDIKCGEVPRINIPLINKGSTFTEGTWPWLAAVFYSQDNGYLQFQCGATVVSTNAVLTAAHCFAESRRERDYQIVVGRHNLKKWSQGQTLDVSNIIIHEHFRGLIKSADADIAIVKVLDTISFANYVRPACIWAPETTDSRDVVNEYGKVAGWGASEGKRLNSEPLEIMVPIVSREACLQEIPALIDYSSQRTFCAGKLDGSGPCTGDSGSGLLLSRGERWWLRGIVSVRPDARNCTDSSYVLYTDVAQYANWIKTNI